MNKKFVIELLRILLYSNEVNLTMKIILISWNYLFDLHICLNVVRNSDCKLGYNLHCVKVAAVTAI